MPVRNKQSPIFYCQHDNKATVLTAIYVVTPCCFQLRGAKQLDGKPRVCRPL